MLDTCSLGRRSSGLCVKGGVLESELEFHATAVGFVAKVVSQPVTALVIVVGSPAAVVLVRRNDLAFLQAG